MELKFVWEKHKNNRYLGFAYLMLGKSEKNSLKWWLFKVEIYHGRKYKNHQKKHIQDVYNSMTDTPHKTNIAPENGWLDY